MIMKLCMVQYALKLYKVYINDGPELTFTHFKTMSNLVKLFSYLMYIWPRYQVSVNRTIGPLVFYRKAADKLYKIRNGQESCTGTIRTKLLLWLVITEIITMRQFVANNICTLLSMWV